jgi:hypothetical protein
MHPLSLLMQECKAILLRPLGRLVSDSVAEPKAGKSPSAGNCGV